MCGLVRRLAELSLAAFVRARRRQAKGAAERKKDRERVRKRQAQAVNGRPGAKEVLKKCLTKQKADLSG
jgi:hypothetical protein